MQLQGLSCRLCIGAAGRDPAEGNGETLPCPFLEHPRSRQAPARNPRHLPAWILQHLMGSVPGSSFVGLEQGDHSTPGSWADTCGQTKCGLHFAGAQLGIWGPAGAMGGSLQCCPKLWLQHPCPSGERLQKWGQVELLESPGEGGSGARLLLSPGLAKGKDTVATCHF